MNRATAPIDNLLKVTETVKQHGPADLSSWLDQCIKDYIEGGEDLETALGLNSTGRGQEKLITRWKRQQRDIALREAYRHVQGENSWQKADNLRKQINLFEATAWRHVLNDDGPPENYSELRKAMFRALKSGANIPQSTRGIWEIVS